MEDPRAGGPEIEPDRGPGEAARRMWAGDENARRLGIELVDVGRGRAVLRMPVRSDMANGLGVCHGGVVFTLADAAMAYSSNSHGPTALATHGEIDWVAPARAGAILTATAIERYQRGRSAITDVEVVDDSGTVVALFRGRTLRMAERPPG